MQNVSRRIHWVMKTRGELKRTRMDCQLDLSLVPISILPTSMQHLLICCPIPRKTLYSKVALAQGSIKMSYNPYSWLELGYLRIPSPLTLDCQCKTVPRFDIRKLVGFTTPIINIYSKAKMREARNEFTKDKPPPSYTLHKKFANNSLNKACHHHDHCCWNEVNRNKAMCLNATIAWLYWTQH